jgi:hypothetical protein
MTAKSFIVQAPVGSTNILPGLNTTAYVTEALVTKKKKFYNIDP